MFCPYCGTEITVKGANFCLKCGKKLVVESAPNPPVGNTSNPSPNPNLPAGVFYGPMGNLNWLYKGVITEKYAEAPIGTEYITRYEFREQEIVRYKKQFPSYTPKENNQQQNAFLKTMDAVADFTILFSNNDSLVDTAMWYDDTRTEPKETTGDYFYKKIKVIQPNPEEQKISIKHGIDKFSLFVMPEQFAFILAQIEMRCPGAVRGVVYKK